MDVRFGPTLGGKYQNRIATVQRKATLRVTSSYWTVSELAVHVITSVMPIDLKGQEHMQDFPVFDSKEVPGVEEAERVAKVKIPSLYADDEQKKEGADDTVAERRSSIPDYH
ncbi:hypothetical protein J6590_057146 [Homalodisca vitripennis]|nr:hypothetical protein J6590_057146 [Homalodisca vitripennis]